MVTAVVGDAALDVAVEDGDVGVAARQQYAGAVGGGSG